MDLLRHTESRVLLPSVYRGDRDQLGRIADGNLETAWNSESGDHRDASLIVLVPRTAWIERLELTVGFTRRTAAGDLFTGNLRFSEVEWQRDREAPVTVRLDPESRDLQMVPINGPGGELVLRLSGFRPGSHADWREICVSELRVLGRAGTAAVAQHDPVVELQASNEPASHLAEPLPPAIQRYFVLRDLGDPATEIDLVGLPAFSPDGRVATVSGGLPWLVGEDRLTVDIIQVDSGLVVRSVEIYGPADLLARQDPRLRCSEAREEGRPAAGCPPADPATDGAHEERAWLPTFRAVRQRLIDLGESLTAGGFAPLREDDGLEVAQGRRRPIPGSNQEELDVLLRRGRTTLASAAIVVGCQYESCIDDSRVYTPRPGLSVAILMIDEWGSAVPRWIRWQYPQSPPL